MARMVGASGQPRRVALGAAISRRLPLILALVFGLLAAMGVNAYLASLRQAQQPVQMVTVVVAKTDIAERAIIGADRVEVREYPIGYAHRSAASGLSQVVGRVAMSDIAAGEQILSTKVSERGARAGLAYVIPPGKRAITIAVSEVKGVGGFIAPGDLVDVIVTITAPNGAVTRTLFQHIQVLATAQKIEERPGEKPQLVSSVTLAVTPQQAERVILADETGRIRFALRPAGETTFVPTSGASPRTLVPEVGLAPAPIVLASAPKAPRAPAAPRDSAIALFMKTMLPPPAPPAAVPAAPAPPPAVEEVYQFPVMRLVGLMMHSDGRQLAIILVGTRTHIVEPGDSLGDGLTVASIADGKVIVSHEKVTRELVF